MNRKKPESSTKLRIVILDFHICFCSGDCFLTHLEILHVSSMWDVNALLMDATTFLAIFFRRRDYIIRSYLKRVAPIAWHEEDLQGVWQDEA